MQDAWRAYLELALGLTEASRKKATQIIKSLAEQSGAKVEDLQGTAEELLATGMANRESVAKLVRFELDRTLGKVGLATSEEVAELTARIQQLEIDLREARAQAEAAERAASAPNEGATAKSAAKKSTKSTAKKATKAASKKTTASKTTKKAAKKVAKKSTKPKPSNK